MWKLSYANSIWRGGLKIILSPYKNWVRGGNRSRIAVGFVKINYKKINCYLILVNQLSAFLKYEMAHKNSLSFLVSWIHSESWNIYSENGNNLKHITIFIYHHCPGEFDFLFSKRLDLIYL